MDFELKGDQLTVTTPLQLHKMSRSGNTTLLATSRGNVSVGRYKGKTLYAQVNIFQINDEEVKPDVEADVERAEGEGGRGRGRGNRAA